MTLKPVALFIITHVVTSMPVLDYLDYINNHFQLYFKIKERKEGGLCPFHIQTTKGFTSRVCSCAAWVRGQAVTVNGTEL